MLRPGTGGSGFLPKRRSRIDRYVESGFKQDGQEADKDRVKAS
ncbi:MAG: hypothetical protein NTAFB01_07240 [Nitrospira sp.]